jgi:hypothetical protein
MSKSGKRFGRLATNGEDLIDSPREVSTNEVKVRGPSGASLFAAGSKSKAPFSATTRSKRSSSGNTRTRSGKLSSCDEDEGSCRTA